MKKLFVSAILVVSALTASAQLQEAGTFSIEPHVGIGYTTTQGFKAPTAVGYGAYTEEISGGISAELGADFFYHVTERFNLSAGVNFYSLVSDEINKVKYEVNTFDIPILAHYNFTNNFSAFAGLKFAFPFSFKINCDGDKESIKNDIETAAFLLPVGLKCTFNSGWSLSAQYNFSLSKISKDKTHCLDDAKFSPIMLNLGYRFEL